MSARSRPVLAPRRCRSCGRIGGGSRSIEHLGSAHEEVGVAALKAAAAQRLAAGQAQLDLGLAARSESEPLPITSSKAAQLWDALCRPYEVLGFDKAAGRDEAFRQLVLARIIADQQGRFPAGDL
jgi:hypothetical protein